MRRKRAGADIGRGGGTDDPLLGDLIDKLSRAAATSHIGTIARLLKRGIDVNSCDAEGWTALHSAARFGNEGTVRFLLRRGARSHRTSKDIPSLIELAASWNRAEVVSILLRHKLANDKALLQSALGRAAYAGNRKSVAVLVGAGARLTIREAVLLYDIPWLTRLLDERGAANTIIDGLTPLMYAVTSGLWCDYIERLIEILWQHGAHLDARSTDGKTALMYSVLQDRLDLVATLLAHGADPNLADKAGVTPLKRAQELNRPDIVTLLKHYGAKE